MILYLFLAVVGMIIVLMMYNLAFSKTMLVKYLAVNIITACMVVSVVLFVVIDSSRTCYLDVAIIYVLIGFVFNIAIMKYLKEIK